MRAGRFLFVAHDAGGTVPPMLAVAQALLAGGHMVTVLGQPSIGARATASGCRFEAFRSIRDYDRRIALEEQLALAGEVIAGASPGDDLLAVAEREGAEVVVVDCNLAGAASAAESLAQPSVILLHSMFRTFVDTWFAGYWPLLEDVVNGVRGGYGLGPRRSWPDLFSAHDRIVSPVPAVFDAPVPSPPAAIRHVGFLVPDSPADELAPPIDALLPDGYGPAVLVALSTTYQQQEPLLATIVDALGELEVRGLVTTGGHVHVDARRVPANVAVHDFVPHPRVLPFIDAVVTHAGLGTAAAALNAGVPLVCVPMGRDQELNAEQVVALGAGELVAGEPTSRGIADALDRVLADGSYRDGAAALARASANAGGPPAAARELESLLPS